MRHTEWMENRAPHFTPEEILANKLAAMRAYHDGDETVIPLGAVTSDERDMIVSALRAYRK